MAAGARAPILREAVLGDLAATEPRAGTCEPLSFSPPRAPRQRTSPPTCSPRCPGQRVDRVGAPRRRRQAAERAAPEVAQSYLRVPCSSPRRKASGPTCWPSSPVRTHQRPRDGPRAPERSTPNSHATANSGPSWAGARRMLTLSIRFVEAADVLERAMASSGTATHARRVTEGGVHERMPLEFTTRSRIRPLIEEIQERPLAVSGSTRGCTRSLPSSGVRGRDRELAVDHARRALAEPELMARRTSSTWSSRSPSCSTRTSSRKLAGTPNAGSIPLNRGLAHGLRLASNACSIVALQGGQVSDAIAYARQSVSRTRPSIAAECRLARGRARARGDLEEAAAELAATDGRGTCLPCGRSRSSSSTAAAPRGPQRARERHSRPASGGRAVRAVGKCTTGLRLVALRRRALPRRDRRARGGLRLAREELELATRWAGPGGGDRPPRHRECQGGAEGLESLRGAAAAARALRGTGRARARPDRSGVDAQAHGPAQGGTRAPAARNSTSHTRPAPTARRSCARGARGGRRAPAPRCSARTRRSHASELRVAAHGASGQTNRQIAQALFVTLRTVELHLTSAYGSSGSLAQAARRGAGSGRTDG